MPESIKINKTAVRIIKDDLTAMDVESIVFYARPDLALVAGYGNAISTRGGPSIKAELENVNGIAPFESVVTTGGNLKAKYIIHAIGPAFQEEEIESKLEMTVNNALKSAEEKGIKQLAFPIMGIGFYGMPPDKSISIMLSCFKKHLENSTNLDEIIICANDNREFRSLSTGFENFN